MPNDSPAENTTTTTSTAAPPASAPAPEHRPVPVAAIVAIVSVVLLLGTVLYVFSLREQLAQLKVSSSQAIEAHLKTIVMQTQQVEALDRLAVRVDQFNREFGGTVGKLQLGDNLEANLAELKGRAHLPDEAKQTLDEFEQSLAAISELSAKMKEFERYLGAPSVVQRGESHSQIARRYLVQEAKLDPKEADRVLRRTALAWELEPGNLVFNLFHEGTLLTTVAQGTARRSPLMAQWSRREAVNAQLLKLEADLATCRAGAVAVPSAEPAATDAAAEPAAAPAAAPAAEPAAVPAGAVAAPAAAPAP